MKIEEKVGEIPADKIDKVVSAKDEKNVNDKIRRKINSKWKKVYGEIDWRVVRNTSDKNINSSSDPTVTQPIFPFLSK